MQTNFEKSLRKVRAQLKRVINEEEKSRLREELIYLKKMIKKEKISS